MHLERAAWFSVSARRPFSLPAKTPSIPRRIPSSRKIAQTIRELPNSVRLERPHGFHPHPHRAFPQQLGTVGCPEHRMMELLSDHFEVPRQRIGNRRLRPTPRRSTPMTPQRAGRTTAVWTSVILNQAGQVRRTRHRRSSRIGSGRRRRPSQARRPLTGVCDLKVNKSGKPAPNE